MSTKIQRFRVPGSRFKGSGLKGEKPRKQLIADKGKAKGAWQKALGIEAVVCSYAEVVCD